VLREEQDQAPQLSRRAMGEPEPPNVTWVLTADAWPHAGWPRGPDFTAFHGELLVGRIFQHQDGPEKGLWVWTMSVARPGLAFPGPTSGVEARQGDAGRCVAEAYWALLKHIRDAPDREQPLSTEATLSEAPLEPELTRQQRRYKERQLKKQQRQATEQTRPKRH